ncbi:MAG: hypothetical protein MUF81_04000 [Verrucomicrobia bacterium]|jgi:hypothetical protein|nr:hypothetical protein [Verrucomicrobiota bacterium]
MNTLTLIPLETQAPACPHPAPHVLPFPPCQHTGHVIKTPHIANAEAAYSGDAATRQAAALDIAAERLELFCAEIETDARRHWQHGQDADGMADWLKSAALKFAIRTLQARLYPGNCASPGTRHPSLVTFPAPVSFDYARRVLWNVANEWAQIAGLSLSIPDHETHGSALTNAAALRYAAQLLANELPATESALAA